MTKVINPGLGYGGMLAIDVEDAATANVVVARMQKERIGLVAVSLGCYRTLSILPSSSTASEIAPEEQQRIGLSRGLIRFSMGIDPDPERVFLRVERCLKEAGH